MLLQSLTSCVLLVGSSLLVREFWEIPPILGISGTLEVRVILHPKYSGFGRGGWETCDDDRNTDMVGQGRGLSLHA